MIIQRLFSKTWKNLKTEEERSKKAKELLRARKDINARRSQIQAERLEGLKDSALGENTKYVTDKAGKRIKDAAGNYWTNPVTAEEVESRYKSKIKDLNAYTNSILDKSKKHPKEEKKITEVIKEKGSELIKNKRAKKLGYIGAGAIGGSLAIDGISDMVKKHKDKKRENDIKDKVSGRKG